ncbi:MAG: adenylate/guanylate cyclase domain-containing protein [Chlamydiae bacterium]|nr:adenylate/guanylate cyclase domain-containing protein [Chlamydiota bacterium]
MNLLNVLLKKLSKQLWPLGPTLITSMMLIIVFIMLSLGIPSYFIGKNMSEKLWENLAAQIASSTSRITLNYLDTAKPVTRFLHEAVLQGALDLKNRDQIRNFTADILHSYDNFTWVAFASITGEYTAARRPSGSPFIYGRMTTIEEYNSIGTPKTLNEQRVWDNHLWKDPITFIDNYDPRTRPFWKEGIFKIGGSWSSPFKEWDSGLSAFSYTLIQNDAKGALQGLWEIQFRTDYLSSFLSSLKIGKSGELWIISQNGTIFASSKGAHFTLQSVNTTREQNPLLFNAWQALALQGERQTSFSFGDYLAYIKDIPNLGNLNWKILTIIPKSDFLGPIEHLSRILIIGGIALCILFSLLGNFFFAHISEQLRAVAYEINELGRLNISSKNFGRKSSFIKEVSIMLAATARLKIGLNSFIKYVPLDIINNVIRSGRQAILGSRKDKMTVMFSDLTNFTELAEQLPPVRLLEILSDYFTAMGLTIQESHGQIDKFIGDSIMAFWTSSDVVTGHAKSACHTALIMKIRLEALSREWHINNMPFLSQRIGIHTGSLMVGNIGSPEHMQYTIIGDSVNLGSSLEALNKFYGTDILVSENTVMEAGPEFLFRPLDFISINDQSEVLLIYELIGEIEKVSPEIRHAVETYKEGLQLYRAHKFMYAVQKFEEALEAFKDHDLPSVLMAQRCRNYVLHAPPATWDGTSSPDENKII